MHQYINPDSVYKLSKEGIKMPKKEMCHCGHGWPMIVAGVLVLANAWWPMVSWPVFVGGLAVIGGLWKMLMPCKCK